MTWLVVFAIVTVILGVSLYVHQHLTRQQTARSLERLISRVEGLQEEPIEKRKVELLSSLSQIRANLLNKDIKTRQVTDLLQKFHLQVARLEQEQRSLREADADRRKLKAWVDRFRGEPEGSDLADLLGVAQQALRITTGLAAEGDLPRSRERASEACQLLQKQLDAIELTRTHLETQKKRLEAELIEAENAGAPILLRPAWQRVTDTAEEITALEARGRYADASEAVSHLQSDLEQVTLALFQQLGEQEETARREAISLLTDLLLWPPDAPSQREQARGLLDRLEADSESATTALSSIRRRLETAQGALDVARGLSREHRSRWEGYLASLFGRLSEHRLEAVQRHRSLPDAIRNELIELVRLRARARARQTRAAPWHLSEDLTEYLDREEQVLTKTAELIATLEQRLKGLSARLVTLERFMADAFKGLSARALREGYLALEEKLAQRDLQRLEQDVALFEGTLASSEEEVSARALSQASAVLHTMDLAVTELETFGLLPFAGTAGEALKKDRRRIKAALEVRGVQEALEAAGSWQTEAPRLVALARRKQRASRVELLRKALNSSPTLPALPEPVREKAHQERKDLDLRLEALAKELDASDFEPRLASLETSLEQMEAALQREARALFQQAHGSHGKAMERLSGSTVQFYLSDEAVDALSEARALDARCRPLLLEGDIPGALLKALVAGEERLNSLWRDALPRARRFYARQLHVIGIELTTLRTEDLPSEVAEEVLSLRKQREVLAGTLLGDEWEVAVASLEGLAEKTRVVADRADQLRNLSRWLEVHKKEMEQLSTSLASVACHRESAALRTHLEAWEKEEGRGGSVESLRNLRSALERALEQGRQALRQAVEEIERSRQEQGELETWRQLLSMRKQDLDWVRATLRDLLAPTEQGLDLRRGLNALQALQRSLEPISLDLRAAASHDKEFRAWLEEVGRRTEAQFRKEFQEELESLHERSGPMRTLVAEVVAQVDALLSSSVLEPPEQERYERMQTRGDAYHKFFAKHFS